VRDDVDPWRSRLLQGHSDLTRRAEDQNAHGYG
jgi:hypothetical protein